MRTAGSCVSGSEPLRLGHEARNQHHKVCHYAAACCELCVVTHVVGWAGGGPKEPIPRLCKRPYLIQVHGTPSVRKGTVITCQKKAWMDSPGVAMWEDVSLARLGRKLVIWDNCGPHKVEAIQKIFHEAETATAELPPNMTRIRTTSIT